MIDLIVPIMDDESSTSPVRTNWLDYSTIEPAGSPVTSSGHSYEGGWFVAEPQPLASAPSVAPGPVPDIDAATA